MLTVEVSPALSLLDSQEVATGLTSRVVPNWAAGCIIECVSVISGQTNLISSSQQSLEASGHCTDGTNDGGLRTEGRVQTTPLGVRPEGKQQMKMPWSTQGPSGCSLKHC